MTRLIRKPARVVFAAALLGSLGFGASQAFAGQILSTDPTPTWCSGPDCKVDKRGMCVCW